jgi:hypothetical protein
LLLVDCGFGQDLAGLQQRLQAGEQRRPAFADALEDDAAFVEVVVEGGTG